MLPRIIAKLRAIAPKIQEEIVASNEASDLRRREADIALRNFQPTQPYLIVGKLKDVSARLYAATSYLEQIGYPKSAKDLEQVDFIGFDTGDRFIAALNDMGLNVSKRNFPLLSASHTTQWEPVKQGLGIGIMPDEIGDAEPLVQQVLPEFPPLVFPVWLTTHRELRNSRRIRIVFDLLAEELGRQSGSQENGSVLI